MKILILKPSSLGDVIQALPVLRLLRQGYPGSAIYWWIDARLSGLLEGDPDLAGVLKFHRHRWAEPTVWRKSWELLRWVRHERFDLVIDLQCLARTAIFAWLANGVRTIGLDEPREGARGFYDHAVRRRSFTTHAVDWYLSVLPLVGIQPSRDFTWLPPRAAARASVQDRWAVEDSEWVLVQPGARWNNKRWPIRYFQELLRQLARENSALRFAVMGGAEDRNLGAELTAGEGADRVLDLTGKLSLPEMIEWVRLSRMMISNDTGPMHVAAAVGTPVVSLFGPTEPRRTGPYGQLHHSLQVRLGCVPCLSDRCRNPRKNDCLERLEPGVVFETALRVLRAPRPRAPGDVRQLEREPATSWF